ncbi:MAG: hypothetical protein N3A01_08125 [Bacteroidales bacterium]|nr:hypothetical protein [Bacteroidales bacterium]
MNNFEDNIRNLFDDYNETPSKKVWNNIQEYLFVEKIKNNVKEISLNPSKYVWYKIALKLQFINFFSFSLNRINFYTVSFVLLLSFFIHKQLSVNEAKILFPKAKRHEDKAISLLYNFRDKNINDNKQNNETKDTINLTSFKTFAVESHNEDFMFTEDCFATLYPKNIASIQNIKIKEYDINYNNINAIPLRSHLNFITGIGINFFRLLNKTNDDANLYVLNNIIPSLFFVGIEKQYYNFSLQTGLYFGKHLQILSFYNKINKTEINTVYHIIPYDVYTYNSYQVLNIDSLIANGDTVWITLIDSTYLYTTYDTTVTINYTEKQHYNYTSNRFNITNIKIPFISEYFIPFGIFSVGIKGGISISYFSLKNISYNKFQKNVMLSIITGFGISCLLNNKINLYSAINYENNLLCKSYNERYFEFNKNSFTFVMGLKYRIK